MVSFFTRNKNKKRIRSTQKKEIKDLYFKGISIREIADNYGYDYNMLESYLKRAATKERVLTDGTEVRRCNVCGLYKNKNDTKTEKASFYFYKAKKTEGNKVVRRYSSNCKACDRRINENKRILTSNLWGNEKYNVKNRRSWNKNKWKYNTRRRVLRTIGYLSLWGKINKNFDEEIRFKLRKRKSIGRV